MPIDDLVHCIYCDRYRIDCFPTIEKKHHTDGCFKSEVFDAVKNLLATEYVPKKNLLTKLEVTYIKTAFQRASLVLPVRSGHDKMVEKEYCRIIKKLESLKEVK